MDFRTYIGTKVFFGKNCLFENKNELKKLGKKAMIVTGSSSGRISGALSDTESVLNELNIQYFVYDQMPNNPSLDDVKKASSRAREFGIDFVIGIGGGSPLDSSKAIAVLYTNNIEPVELYTNVYSNKPLSIVAIPTTAGTGSEVTPYCILTRDDMQTKVSFGNEDTYPVFSFIDSKYTVSLNYDVTVSTAIDAFTHSLEGYLSKRSSTYSDMFAYESMKVFGECIRALRDRSITENIREKLMYVSMLGGLTICHTGTTIMHGLGYNLTYFKDVFHGKANVYFLREYLKFIYPVETKKVENVLMLMGCDTIDNFMDIVDGMFEKEISISSDEVKIFAEIAIKQRSAANTAREVTVEDLCDIISKSLIVRGD